MSDNFLELKYLISTKMSYWLNRKCWYRWFFQIFKILIFGHFGILAFLNSFSDIFVLWSIIWHFDTHKTLKSGILRQFSDILICNLITTVTRSRQVTLRLEWVKTISVLMLLPVTIRYQNSWRCVTCLDLVKVSQCYQAPQNENSFSVTHQKRQ